MDRSDQRAGGLTAAAVLTIGRWLRALIRRVRCRRRDVSAARKALAVVLFTPPFLVLYPLFWVLGRLRPVRVEVRTSFGARCTARLPDLVETYIYLFGVWEPDISRFVRSRLSVGDTFVDVGANVGYHALLAARCLEGTGRVVAVEPTPRIFRTLQSNLALNRNGAAVRAVNMAAADRVGTITVYGGPAHNRSLSTTVAGRGFRREATIGAAPLADLLEPRELRTARLVKIDVEGAEDQVLEGMASFLAACRPDVEILIELSPAWWPDRSRTPRQVLRACFDAGFHAYEIDNTTMPWRYLWPRAVGRPRRLRRPLDRRMRRLDLVLSRLDQEEL